MGYVFQFRKTTTYKSTLLLLLLLSIIIIIIIVVVVLVMVWSGRIQSRQSVKKGDHSRRKAIRIYFTADFILQHPQNAADNDVELHVLGYWCCQIFAKYSL